MTHIDAKSVGQPSAVESPTTTVSTGSISHIRPSQDDSTIYGPLDTNRPHIRLARVWHGIRAAAYPFSRNEDAKASCTNDMLEAAKAPPCIALSYCWGDPTPAHFIQLNGESHCVRENLYQFLDAFGKSERGQSDHYLWIDQMCINQTNTQERNHQVDMMADIYQNAEFVISWLDLSFYPGMLELANCHAISAIPKEKFEPIKFDRYFSRLWIVQEVLLAKHIHLVCGDVWINRDDFEERHSVCQTRRTDIEFGAEALFNELEDRKRYQSLEKPPLIDVLRRYTIMKCEDPRDKIYGLLGLVNLPQRIPKIDYHKPLYCVY